MDILVDIDVVVIAALAMALLTALWAALGPAAGEAGDRAARRWLLAANAMFLMAATALIAGTDLGFAAGGALIVAGSHLGLVFGLCALAAALGRPVAVVSLMALSVTALAGQVIVALAAGVVAALMISSSVVNGLIGLLAALWLWRAAGGEGRAVALLVSVPFAVVALAYAIRLAAVLVLAPPETVIAATAVILLTLAFAAMAWAFALAAVASARLTRSLAEARAEAERLAAAKADFLAEMSHEIRTPLNGVVGVAELLEEEVTAAEPRRLVAIILRSGELLRRLVDDILDDSKLAAGKVTLEDRVFDLRPILEQIAATLGARAEARGVRFTLELADGATGPWRGDASRLAQVLNNLVGNAVKFTQAGQVRVVATPVPAGGIEIVVADTGTGMTPAQAERLFEPYAQADAATARRFGGTGLGLSIARRLVALMGGTIDADSMPGEGTRMRVRLPLPRAETGVPAMAPTGLPAPALQRLAVLCADDNATNRLVLGAMLERLGCTVEMTESGEAALAAAQAAPFDVYCLDKHLSGMSGAATLAALRDLEGREGRRRAAAVAVTADVLPESISRSFRDGFDAHLPKPLRRADLARVLAGLAAPADTAAAAGSAAPAGSTVATA